MPILTDARNALWDAIENWPALQSGGSPIWKRSFKFDGDDSPEINPNASQLPAIAIYPEPGFAKMVLNKVQEQNYKLIVMLFTSTWNLSDPDTYWEEIVKAAWQSDGGGGTPYIKLATGFHPKTEITVDQHRIKVDPEGKPTKATLTLIGLTLQVRFNPQG